MQFSRIDYKDIGLCNVVNVDDANIYAFEKMLLKIMFIAFKIDFYDIAWITDVGDIMTGDIL